MLRWETKENIRSGSLGRFMRGDYVRITKTPKNLQVSVCGLFLEELVAGRNILESYGQSV